MSTTVLVIEDEACLRDNLVNLLVREGFNAIAAANGRDGFHQAKTLKPALILCDVKMEEMDGYAVLQQLRQDPSTANVAFIFLSGQVEQAHVRLGMNLGADDYLLKPVQPKELIQAIQSRLKRQASLQRSATISNLPVPEIASTASVSQPQSRSKAIAYNQAASPQPTVALNRPTLAAVDLAHDALANLPNRASLPHLLTQVLAKARDYDCLVTVLSLNVVRFSSINAAFGFAVGDVVLNQLAHRLHQQVDEHGVVIRTNGDEFTIILDDLTWEEDALHWADVIWRVCSEAFVVDGRRISLQLAIGGAYVHHGQGTPEQLMLQTDMARRACEQWGGQVPYIFHDANLAAQTVEQRLLETDLNRAIHQGEFQIYYQPQICLPGGQVTGVEALLRWRHPYRGMVSPERFITIAEEMGLIVPLGEWVLRTACLQVKRWQGISPVPLKLSVNLSIRQLQQENLPSQITRILQAVDLNPQQLTLELTETNLMADIDQAIQILTALRSLGIKIAIDDFGKGYSSLHYLSRLPIDILKIDQSFVRRLPDDNQAVAISNAIITLAHDLKLEIVAEGVETDRQVRFLTDHGCRIMQGHLYSRALPPEDFVSLLQHRNCA
ncbi:EAL domain-containing protein [filamentous cyanobacterium LEGE 11480]|uniref:EAL domain-containing protein n=1 Tax=Romeriopsis navalis LEGE 11480 TaxID=2777977 RepID=A0A928VQK5_9CYAN|nr:EAL domain-containing response regulator [Romeriopsis navalis]MBE9031932.1 EAL domain-containing protein [Romeriopsis navalis LEGE 11480]